MRFFFARDTHTCLYCRSEVNQGEPFVRVMITGRQGGKVGLIFHPECYPKWAEEKYIQKFLGWMRDQIPPRGRGRPRKYKDSVKANRLKTLQNHHKKASNADRVLEIELEIKELEDG